MTALDQTHVTGCRRLSPESEQIAAAVEAREAAHAAVEDDPGMAGSEAQAAWFWENGGEDW
jgi:hypothetical protein